MSIELTNKVWNEANVSGSELLVLLALADHANDEGICWPSLPRIAQRSRLSARQTQRIIQKLLDDGQIAIIVKGDGRGHSTRYLMTIKDDTATSTLSQQKGDTTMSPFLQQKDDIAVSTFDEERVTSGAIKGDIAMSTESPYKEERERESLPPAALHRTLPGVKHPRWRAEKRDADRIAKQRAAMGLNAKQLTELTDTVLLRMNALELANSDTDFGDEEFRQAQQTALALASVGYKTPAEVEHLFSCWVTEDWRGKKGESPTYKSLVDHAKASRTRRPQATPKTVMVVERMEGENW